MTSNQKGFVVVAISLGLGYFVYLKQFPPKRNQIHYLMKGNFSEGTIAQLMSFDNAFIKAWFLAAKDAKNTFTVDGKTYNTKGGTAT